MNCKRKHGYQVVGYTDDIMIIIRDFFLSTLMKITQRALKLVET